MSDEPNHETTLPVAHLQERRQELADLMLPVIKTFQGSLTAELAKRAGEVA